MELRNTNRGAEINFTSSFTYSPSSTSSPDKLPSTQGGQITILPPTTTLDPPTHHHKIHRPKSPSQSSSSSSDMIRYRECQRNHAAHLGSHVLDGCGEFMPTGEEGTPLALKCAACDCHRNFHRKDIEGDTATATAAPPPLLTPPPLTTANCYISFHSPKLQKHPTVRSHVGPAHNHHHHQRAPVMMAFGGGAAAESSSEDLNAAAAAAGQLMEQYGALKKRYRTKFTQEQKEKMTEVAEKIGWRMQKQDEAEVQRLCGEVGIKRQVFKVWLHNNKQAMKRKQSS